MASLDVESLYSNVPIDTTIDIILHNVYNHPTIPRPFMDEHILKALLCICTKKAPFKHIDGTIFQQTEGLAMGGPLSCTMANYYMCHIENRILENQELKPSIYGRFIDDIFVLVRDQEHLTALKQAFHDESVLNITHEVSINNKLPFLDVLLELKNRKFYRAVYTKPTKCMDCINYNCDAPERYKTGVLYTLLRRAQKICNTLEGFNDEVSRIKLLLINNGFPNCVIDGITRKFIFQEEVPTTGNQVNPGPTSGEDITGSFNQSATDRSSEVTDSDRRRPVTLFYNNQFHAGYRRDEEAIRKIFKKHVCQIEVKIQVLIYYKSKKTSNILMNNNLSKIALPDRDRSHVVYEFNCSEGECSSSNNSYIGMTNCSLSERLGAHRYKGSIFEHYRRVHNKSPNVADLINSSNILYFCDNRKNLPVYEALFIKKCKPTLNENTRDFSCLKLNIS